MAQERLFELPELVATDACPRIEVVRRDRERLEHLGELLLGKRLAALAVLAPLGPRTALDRDQRLAYVRRRDLGAALHGTCLRERVTDVGKQQLEPCGVVVFSAHRGNYRRSSAWVLAAPLLKGNCVIEVIRTGLLARKRLVLLRLDAEREELAAT